jgi:tRNA-2-methylthio-N6-dimethylallyladenosine synthase
VPVLFEERIKKGRWRGRTETNKLVFADSKDDLQGKILPVSIHWTGPWSMLGNLQP